MNKVSVFPNSQTYTPIRKKNFFYIWVFFHDHSRIAGVYGKGEGISLTLHYLFHLLHRHLEISQACD